MVDESISANSDTHPSDDADIAWHNEMDSLNVQKQSFEEEYAILSNRFERALIEHKLAAQYFGFRSFYFAFLPLTLIATATTIIGFLISGSNLASASEANNDGAQVQDSVQFEPQLTGQSKQLWSIVVGVLGAISTLLNTIGKHTNYQSQYDMHRSAVKALEKICLTVDFEKDWFKRKDSKDFLVVLAKKRVKNLEAVEQENLTNMLGADLKSHQASFKAMQDACCDSPAPAPVIQAFTVMDQVLGEGLKHRGIEGAPFFYHKLWKEFSTYPLWPLKAPSPDIILKGYEWVKETKPRAQEYPG